MEPFLSRLTVRRWRSLNSVLEHDKLVERHHSGSIRCSFNRARQYHDTIVAAMNAGVVLSILFKLFPGARHHMLLTIRRLLRSLLLPAVGFYSNNCMLLNYNSLTALRPSGTLVSFPCMNPKNGF